MIKESGISYDIGRIESIAENRTALSPDGSLSREFLESRLGRKVEPSEIHVSDDCQSLQEYLEKFDLPGQCLQDEKGLELAGYDVLKV